MKILIVEDEIGIVQFLQQGLEEEGYEVNTALDGEEGLALALKNNYDLLLLDWMLPKLSGLELCTEFRIKNTNTPVLFLTAKDTVQETIDGLKAGANDYIKKPFSFEELLLRIQVQFKSKSNDNTVLKLNDIRIEMTTHKVFRNENEIVLTQKEFGLLTYLIKNKGVICTRNQIIKDVWNIHFEYDTGVIDVFMNAIRKKLGIKKEDQCIKTIRGIGYIANDANI